MSQVEAATEALQEELGESVAAVETFRGQTTVVLDTEAIQRACEILRDKFQFNFLAALTAVDHWPDEPRFAVVYQLYSLPHNLLLGLKVMLPGDAPEVPSISSIYPNANWHEREVYDMFGVTFADHPDQRRILMPYDWEGHPLRKDYPLGYEEVQFSFNFDDIDKRKKYAKE